jgi:hypothetical protein
VRGEFCTVNPFFISFKSAVPSMLLEKLWGQNMEKIENAKLKEQTARPNSRFKATYILEVMSF